MSEQLDLDAIRNRLIDAADWGDRGANVRWATRRSDVEALMTEVERLRDERLGRDNAEIDYQQTLQRVQKAGELLEGLRFWPSPDADVNLARDIGRVLQGKSPERSYGVEEALSDAGVFAMSWKHRAEAAESERDQLKRQAINISVQLSNAGVNTCPIQEGVRIVIDQRDALRQALRALIDKYQPLSETRLIGAPDVLSGTAEIFARVIRDLRKLEAALAAVDPPQEPPK